jgi:hypothetical protein
MPTKLIMASTSLRRHWFFALLPVLVLAGWNLARTAPPGDAALVERVLIADVCLSVPILYALCYARRMPLRRLLVRCLGLALAGLVVLGWTLPAEQQSVLPATKPLRIAAMALLALVELRILIAALQLVFRSAPRPELLEERGVPPLIAKLMVIEARFWKAVWRLLRRK